MPTVLQRRNEWQLPHRYGKAGVVLLGELNDFSLGDKIGTSLAAIADFKIFKISAGHRVNPPRGLTKGTA